MQIICTHNGAARPIALLDSGAGGIGVLREVKKLLPREQLLYFGDSRNAPYGEKSAAEIERLVLRAAARLLQTAKALVLACNTATAVAAARLRERYWPIPIIGMEPALRPAIVAGHRRVLVLATAATLREKKFLQLCQTCERSATVLPLSAPGIVRLVETGRGDSLEMDAYLQSLLAPYRGKVDAVVLGCTHFPFALQALRRCLGDLPFYDGAAGTARELKRRLAQSELLLEEGQGGVCMSASDPASLPLMVRLLSE